MFGSLLLCLLVFMVFTVPSQRGAAGVSNGSAARRTRSTLTTEGEREPLLGAPESPGDESDNDEGNEKDGGESRPPTDPQRRLSSSSTSAATSALGHLGQFFRLDIAILSTAVAIGVASFAYQEVFLSPYEAHELGLSITATGLMFIPSSVTYSLMGPICGYLVDKGWSGEMIALGQFGGGVCNILLAVKQLPAVLGALLLGGNVKAAAWIVQLGVLSAFGVTQSFVLIPTLPLMRACVDEDDEAATETVVGIFFGMQMLGATVGSLLGGVVDDKYGFFFAFMLLGVANCVYALFVGICWRFFCRRRKPPSEKESLGGGDLDVEKEAAGVDFSRRAKRVQSPSLARIPSVPRDIVSQSAPPASTLPLGSSASFRTPTPVKFPICALGVSARSPHLLSGSFRQTSTPLAQAPSLPSDDDTPFDGSRIDQSP